MEAAPFTIADVVIVAVVLVSGLLAFVRGFMREFFGLAGLIVAFVAGWWAYETLGDVALGFIDQEPVARWGSAIVAFLVVWFGTTLIAHWVSKKTLDSPAGMIDRTLGFAFGAVRGVFILSVLLLLFSKFGFTEQDYPQFVYEAKFLPILQDSALLIEDWGGALIESVTGRTIRTQPV